MSVAASASIKKKWYMYSMAVFVIILFLLIANNYFRDKVGLNRFHPLPEVTTGTGTNATNFYNEMSTKHSNYLWDFRTQPLLPRSAFLNELLKTNKLTHCKNATVIFVAILKTALRDHVVTGCESKGHRTRDFMTEVFVQYGYVHTHKPLLTHDGATVTCCNMPVQNGSTIFVLYKNKMGHERKVKTERELYIPPGRPHFNERNQQKPAIVVCVTVYGKPSWLSEWLVYQKTIGVDHIYLYAQQSFIDDGSANNTILQQYLDTNYATLDVWPAYLNNSQVYYYQQVLFYQDCIYRHRKTFDYALLYDTDDFFVPAVPGETDIHYYVQKLFEVSNTRDSAIGSINFLWSLYHPDCGLTQDPSTIKDGNITRYLVNKKKDKSNEYIKSIHKLSAVNEIGVHEAVKMVQGYKSKRVPTSWAYIAHLRTNTLKKHPNACKGYV